MYEFHMLDYLKVYTYMDTLVVMSVSSLIPTVVTKGTREGIRKVTTRTSDMGPNGD